MGANGERMRKWKGNGERRRKFRGNGERMRKWREIHSLHFLIFSLFSPFLSISYIKTRQSKHCEICIYLFDNFFDQSKWMVRLVRAEKMVLSGLVFAKKITRMQTWNLSKILHRRIFRLKILHRQFHIHSTVLVGKKHKKWVKMEKFTPLAKILHCRRQWRHWQIPPLAGWFWFRIYRVWWIPWWLMWHVCLYICVKCEMSRHNSVSNPLRGSSSSSASLR